VSTAPTAGADLREGSSLVLRVSLGNTLRNVPAGLVGKPIADATAMLTQAGLKAKQVDAFDEKAPKGTVLEVLTAAKQIPKDGVVELRVSGGPAPRTIPGNLAGKTYAEADAAIKGLQLAPKKVEEFSDTVEKGRVIGTRPGGGEKVAKGATVEIVVSRGPDVVSVPNVSGMDLDDAIAKIEAAGLTVSEVEGPPRGEVFASDPEAGAKVKRGTSVVLYVRR
jgi:serine/threonine-protein kinase